MNNHLINCYWQICLLRESPANTPYSIIRMFLGAIFLALLMVIEWGYSPALSAIDLSHSLWLATCILISYVIYTYVILFLKGHTSRLVQTLTALFCTSIIIHIFLAPLLILAPYLGQIENHNILLLIIGICYLFVSIGLSIWQFLITAHIYKNALSTTAVQSIIAALGLMIVNVLTVTSIQ